MWSVAIKNVQNNGESVKQYILRKKKSKVFIQKSFKGTVYGETDLYFMFEMSYLGLEELKKNIIIEMLHGKSISSGSFVGDPI